MRVGASMTYGSVATLSPAEPNTTAPGRLHGSLFA